MTPARPPRLVATDLDGTLLRSDGTCSDRTRAALAAVERAGIHVVLVTARPPRWLSDLVDLVGEQGVVLCANGAFVYDVRSRQVLEEHCLSAGLVVRIADDLRNALPGIAFAAESRLGFGRERDFCDANTTPQDVTAALLEELLDPLPGKLLARCDGVPAEQFHRVVLEVVGDRAVVSYSGASGLAEISGAGVTKAAALGKWCAARGIDPADVYAFGDMPNDLPMLTWAGRSFGVANAHPDVLDLVDEVCASNDEDGVAQVLENFGTWPAEVVPARLAQTGGMTSTACPSWCHTTHAEGESEPTRHYGPHWPPLRGEEGFSADVAAVLNENGNIGVWLPADHREYLTTAQARSVARALLAASDWVDANRDT